MRLTGTLAALLLAQPALFVCAGCDSRVGDKYTGEPLLTIHGTVVQSGDVAADLVPVLGFKGTREDYDRLELIDAHVSGEFPAKFQLDFTQPPADYTIYSGQYADARLYLVPKDHLPEYKLTNWTWNMERVPAPGAGSCDAGDSCTGQQSTAATYEVRISVCDTQCLVKRYRCHDEPCELVYSSGDPALATSEQAYHTGNADPFPEGYQVSVNSYYDNNDMNHSYRTIHYCDTATADVQYPFGPNRQGDSVSRCELIEQTGATASPNPDEVSWVARNISVVYVSVDDYVATTIPPLPLARGYNVIILESALAKEETIAAENCYEDARLTAIREINAANGTNFTYAEATFYDNEFPGGTYFERVQELQSQCPVLYVNHLASGSEANPIRISLGSPQSTAR